MATSQCLNTIPAIGALCGQAAPLQKPAALALALPDFQFDTYTDFVNETKWKESIRDEKIFILQELDDSEGADAEDNITTTGTNRKIFNFEGIRSVKYKVTLPVTVHQKLRNYSFQKLRIFEFDMNNNIKATNPSGTVIKGFKSSYFHVSKQKWNDGYVTEITVDYYDINEWDKFGKYVNPDWNISDLESLTAIQLTCSTVNQTTHVLTATAAYVDNAELTGTGIAKSVPISGLLPANFALIKHGTTTVWNPETAVETATPGVYTLTCHTPNIYDYGTAQVVPSTTALYKSDIETTTSA